jgi:hypothetical protein
MQAENKTVDIDTSGPEVEVELENQQEENTSPEVEASTEETSTEVEAKEEQKEQPKKADEEKDKDEAEAKISKLEPGYLKSTEDSILSGMTAAKAELAKAREAGDIEAEVAAQAKISELGYKKAKFEETKAAQEEFNKTKEEKPVPELRPQGTSSSSRPDPKAEEWAANNSWFGQDTAMTYTAFDLHKKLTEDEGYDPQSDEYYQEIDKRIRLEFPHKFDTNRSNLGEGTTKPVQTVASAKRSTNTGRKNTVTLTPSQVAIAKKLGVPLKEYAKQLKITKEV